MHQAIRYRNKKSLQTISEICIAIGQLYAANGLYYGLYRRERSRKNNRHEVHAALSTSRQRNGSAAQTGCKKENAAKENQRWVLDTANFPQSFTTQDVHQMLKRVYSNWDGALYQQYLEQFHLPEKKKFKEFSMGMKKKVSCGSCSCPSSKAFDFG